CLMSEREMEESLLALWAEKATVKVPGKAVPLREESLLETMKRVLEFRTLFGKFCRRGIPGPILDGLLRRKFRATKRGVGETEIAAAVQDATAGAPGPTAPAPAPPHPTPTTTPLPPPPPTA